MEFGIDAGILSQFVYFFHLLVIDIKRKRFINLFSEYTRAPFVSTNGNFSLDICQSFSNALIASDEITTTTTTTTMWAMGSVNLFQIKRRCSTMWMDPTQVKLLVKFTVVIVCRYLQWWRNDEPGWMSCIPFMKASFRTGICMSWAPFFPTQIVGANEYLRNKCIKSPCSDME